MDIIRRCGCGRPSSEGKKLCQNCVDVKLARYTTLVKAGLCTNCGQKPVLFDTRRCETCAYRAAARYRRRTYHYTPELEARYQAARICDFCDNPFNDSVIHQDHDHECCAGAASCGKCLRGLLHGFCNQAALGWFEWQEKEFGITHDLLKSYREKFPRII